jgi:hypothetical protein
MKENTVENCVVLARWLSFGLALFASKRPKLMPACCLLYIALFL